jgi:hypothetical protein
MLAGLISSQVRSACMVSVGRTVSLMGGRRESHPPAPPEPGVNLSAHRAPIIRFVLRPHVERPPIASARGAPAGLA